MNKREKLQLLITGKTPKILEGFKAFDSGVTELKKNLEETIRVSTLDEVSGKLNDLRKKIDFSSIEKAIANLKSEIEANDLQEKQELDTRLSTLKQQLIEADSTNTNNIRNLNDEIEGIQTQIADILSRKPIEIPDFGKQVRESETRIMGVFNDYKKTDDEEDALEAKDLKKQFDEIWYFNRFS